MNIIFLDVDGVLNSTYNLIRVYNLGYRGLSGFDYPFDYDCLNNLKKLVDETDSYIVISSTWRKFEEGIVKINEVFKEIDLDKRIIGYTPVLNKKRGLEIKEYLKNLNNIDYNFVIIDDDDDMLDLSDHLVLTNFYYGLSENNVEEAKRILNNNKIKKL